MVREIVIDASAVHERWTCLRVSADEVPRIEDNRASSSQSEGCEFAKRNTEDVRRGELMRVGFDPNQARCEPVALSVRCLPVISLNTVVCAE